MTEPSTPRLSLLVLYTGRLEACREFYAGLGAVFAAERHGQGPAHWAAVLADGTVFELYPARPGRETGALRLGLTVEARAAVPPLAPGDHLLTDPDGRTVEVRAV